MIVDGRCVGCGQCAAYCPYDAIIVFGRAVMDEKCIECGTCVRYCPVSAISGEE
ncbi:MAG: 4Fe-4S binding protein [Candidatus Methanoperedens sp.]|nr:4Fe-4S binding protein [Candidatus Methanoperedens sp.]MCZ7370169.1 4Fe-4S binding protein [Candidatus Methanoperedens sp.]